MNVITGAALPVYSAPQASPSHAAEARGPQAFSSVMDRALQDAEPSNVTEESETGDSAESTEATADATKGTDGGDARVQHRSALDDFRAFVERVAADGARGNAMPAAAPEAAPTDAAEAPHDAAWTAPATAALDPNMVVRDLNALHPELRMRVERVITRMRDEGGHDVQFAETWRSQARQNRLHEQGRSRAGEIVTWTTHSKHTEGLAADLVIDGSWDNAAAYQQLQKIAQSEGLRTLGARDPGHVELVLPKSAEQVVPTPIAGGTAADALRVATSATKQTANAPFVAPTMPALAPMPAIPTTPALQMQAEMPAPSALPLPQLANKAISAETGTFAQTSRDTEGVAQVAQVAQVARVARVADVAPVTRTSPGEASTNAAIAPTAPRASARGQAAHGDDAEQAMTGDDARHASTAFMTAARGAANEAVQMHELRSDAGARAEQVSALRDWARSQPLSGLVLKVDGDRGVDDRIRVDVRGSRVDASIDVSDVARAADLSRRIPELTRALEARGFDGGSALVRPAQRANADDVWNLVTHGRDFMATDLAGADASSSRSSHDRSGDNPRGRSDQQQEKQEYKQRSRRERPGEGQ